MSAPSAAPPLGPVLPPARPGRRLAAQVAVGLVGVLGVGVAAWSARGSLQAAVDQVAGAGPAWLLLAVAAQALSMSGLARQQRRLVGPVRTRLVSLRSVLATTYAGNSLSVSLPLAGPGVSTAFTYRRYTAGGAVPGQVATALAVSGVLSVSAFVSLLAVAGAASGTGALLVGGGLGLLVAAVPVAVVLLLRRSETARRHGRRAVHAVLRVVRRRTRRPVGDPAVLAEAVVHQLHHARLRRRDLAVGFGHALVNRVADLVVLGAALAAVGGSVPWTVLVLAWGASAAASLNLTPGGIGVTEVTLTAGLVAAGLPEVQALSGVLLYRLICFWAASAVGWLLLLTMTDRGRRAGGRS